nr:PREDICTED: mdm2-binding protein isoform X1 [Anolis carolinensis]|eukprot:XP_016851449.1 PREDICTED: mdm2-binding protein isoform X1 [Anolis carolinensis]
MGSSSSGSGKAPQSTRGRGLRPSRGVVSGSAGISKGGPGKAGFAASLCAMDRYLLLLSWAGRRGLEGNQGGREGASGLTAENIYNLLERNCTPSVNAKLEDFPACSLVGIPGVKEWYFAIQSICGFSQFCSSDWENIDFEADQDKSSIQRNIEECLGDAQCMQEEDSNSRESLSFTDLYEESAESIHLLADKLPAPGKAMVDVIWQTSEIEVPSLKDCLPVIGALKHLREWHAAKITIVTNENQSWQKVADYLSADIVAPENLQSSIDPRELWRGKIQIWERKFASEITFPDFCIKSIESKKPLSTLCFNSSFSATETEQTKNTTSHLPESQSISPLKHILVAGLLNFHNIVHENGSGKLVLDTKLACITHFTSYLEVFHYYSPVLKFVQMVLLSHLPSSFVSKSHFELSLARTNVEEKSRLFWNQMSSLPGKVGALFILPCNVSGMFIPMPSQLSTKKWKEYIARKPKVMNVPNIELKGEMCNYYFLVQGNGCGGCKATLIYSASQINGSVNLSESIGKFTTKTEETEVGLFEEFVRSLPHFSAEQILQREKKLACVQAFALNHCLKKQESVASANELKTLMMRTREHFLELWNSSHSNSSCPVAVVKTEGQGTVCDLEPKGWNSMQWPERSVLQNLENLEKIKQKTRVSEQLLGHKDGQRGSVTLLDAKELLKHFTPEGLPVSDLQPLHIQKSESPFLLTPELSPRTLRSLPFEKAADCRYHGLEYCLDNRRALERDVGFAELQTRLIRYETQTTCTKECCPVPCILSPLPSPAVLSEPGSIPDGESLQREPQTEASRLKRRSKDLDGLYPNKRLVKSESTDSLMSQASISSRSCPSRVVTKQCLETSVSLPSLAAKQPHHQAIPKSRAASQRCGTEPGISRPTKESRSQKHTRMLKEVVAKTLGNHGITEDHKCFETCSHRLFEISKFYLKDLKTSRGLFDEMKKAANSNVKQVIEWVLEKTKEK